MDKNQNEYLEPMMPEPTPEQLAEMEAERQAQDEAIFGPVRRAAEQRRNSAAVIAEHDELLADMLYEITMGQFGEEV